MTELRAPALRGCFCCAESESSLSLSRRGFMLGAGALAVATAVGGGRAAAQTAEKPFRIDVHHHLSPPSYVTASNEIGFGDPLMKNWTIEKSLDDMDKAGIATAMLSVTTPAVNFTKGDAARKLCRESNEYGAKLVADYPGRFGNFAMLPLTDAEGSLLHRLLHFYGIREGEWHREFDVWPPSGPSLPVREQLAGLVRLGHAERQPADGYMEFRLLLGCRRVAAAWQERRGWLLPA